MSEEHDKSSPTQPAKREIKIGSQRPGSEPPPPQKQAPAVRPRPRVQHSPAEAASRPAAETGPTTTHAVTPPESDPPAMVAEATVAETKTEQQTETTTAATDLERSPESQSVVDTLAAPVVDLNMSDDDLEREIALAMGQRVEDLMAQQISSRGDEPEIELDARYLASVVKVFRESVLFELPGQRNGVASLKQFETLPEIGSQREVLVTGFSVDEQMYELSVPGASMHVEDWGDLQEGSIVEAKITGHNKGGLECEVNRIRGFIPAREISIFRVEDFSAFVDQRLQCVVKEANESRRNLVLSHRAILEREREEARKKLLAELAVGQTREGIVARLEKFGAFIDLGGVDGLVHISQLSWDNVRHPEDVLTVGQHITVRIDKFDPESGKIGLSYRDLLHQPWEGIEQKYPIGAVVPGTVSKIMDFGAFVKLEPGVEGLVHISELSHKRVNRVSQVVQEGQPIEVKVLAVDAEGQKISLSIKAAVATPTEDSTDDGPDEPTSRHVPKVPIKSLKGGIGRPSGGEQFGLKW